MRDKINQIISDQLGVSLEQITPSASLIEDLRADSLDQVELALVLEEALKITITDEQADAWNTVQDIYDTIDEIRVLQPIVNVGTPGHINHGYTCPKCTTGGGPCYCPGSIYNPGPAYGPVKQPSLPPKRLPEFEPGSFDDLINKEPEPVQKAIEHLCDEAGTSDADWMVLKTAGEIIARNNYLIEQFHHLDLEVIPSLHDRIKELETGWRNLTESVTDYLRGYPNLSMRSPLVWETKTREKIKKNLYRTTEEAPCDTAESSN